MPRPPRPDDADGPEQGPTRGPTAPTTRRRLLRSAGLGAAAVLSGGTAGRWSARAAPGTAASGPGVDRDAAAGAGRGAWLGGTPEAADHYGHGLQPPAHLGPTALDAVTRPPPAGARSRRHTLDVVETTTAIADGVTVPQWAYAGHVPGPVLRATEGDRLSLTVHNVTGRAHNLHLHGRHAPGMDGWEPIPPGGSFTYELVAGPAGVHPYHCHTMPFARHVAMGLYGTLIVDPVVAREPAHEFVLLLSAWDTDGDGRNDVYTYNGVAGFFARHPLTVPVGELVRVYVLNMVEHEPVASFHLHAQTFDVYRTGTAATPHEHTDTVSMSQGERAVLEFRLPERGRYMFHPHQHHMAEAGALGWFAAV